MGRLGRLLLIYFIIMSLAACQKKKVETANPFFEEWTTPYGVPPFDRIRPEHFLPAFERGMSLHNAEIDAIVGTSDEPTFENTIAAYDASGRMLQRTSLIFEMLAASDATPEMQAVEQEAMPLLAAHADEIRMNERLFGRIKAVYDRREALPLTAEQRRLTEKLYRRFVRSGALLDEAGKRRLKEINGDLSRLSVKYGNNLLHENDAFGLELTADRLEGLPNAVREAAREKAQIAADLAREKARIAAASKTSSSKSTATKKSTKSSKSAPQQSSGKTQQSGVRYLSVPTGSGMQRLTRFGGRTYANPVQFDGSGAAKIQVGSRYYTVDELQKALRDGTVVAQSGPLNSSRYVAAAQGVAK